MRIEGSTALVTGAAVGTGRAIARRLADEGASVVLADIDEDGGQETLRLIGPERARFRRTDLRRDEEVAAMISYVAEEFGHGPEILVNNAGGGPELRPCFPDADIARWTAALDVNLRAPMLATQLVLEPMRQTGGVVVNIGSTAGLGYDVHVSPEYSAAKAALIRFTATLAPLRDRGVRVNCVVPDWIATERAELEYAALPETERASTPPPIPLSVLTDAVVDLIQQDQHAGRILHLPRQGPPAYLN